MLNFRLWLERGAATRGKIGLYPPLYTQYMNYVPSDVILWSADSITYMDKEDRIFKAYDGVFKPYFWHTTQKVTG